MSSLSLLNAAGLAMCDPEPLEDGMLDHNAYGAQHAVDEDGSQERKVRNLVCHPINEGGSSSRVGSSCVLERSQAG